MNERSYVVYQKPLRKSDVSNIFMGLKLQPPMAVMHKHMKLAKSTVRKMLVQHQCAADDSA
jgi:hypothetical protein